MISIYIFTKIYSHILIFVCKQIIRKRNGDELSHEFYTFAICRFCSSMWVDKQRGTGTSCCPAISKQYDQKVGRRNGYQIFTRRRSGIVLTPEGEKFIAGARKILGEVENLKNITSIRENIPLNICTYYNSYVVKLFFDFQEKHPLPLPDKIDEAGTMDILSRVKAGKNSIGLLFYASSKASKYAKLIEDYNLEHHSLVPNLKPCIIASPQHPLAAKEMITLEELKKYPFAFFEDSSSVKYLEILELEGNADIFYTSSRSCLLDAVDNGYLSVAMHLHGKLKRNYICVPISDSQARVQFSYVTQKGYKLSDREKQFIQFIKEA